MIKLTGITKNYDSVYVLHRFNLLIDKPSITCIYGESGCGKSTLLNIIGLIEKTTSGEVTIGEYKDCKPNDKNRAKILQTEISYLFQNYALVNEMSIEQNLMLGLKHRKMLKADKNKKIDEILVDLGIKRDKKAKVYTLSGGEQQRVALARTILRDTNIILCDEPTGNLDEKSALIIIDRLKQLKEDGKIVIIATHDPKMKEIADEIIDLSFENEKNKKK